MRNKKVEICNKYVNTPNGFFFEKWGATEDKIIIFVKNDISSTLKTIKQWVNLLLLSARTASSSST